MPTSREWQEACALVRADGDDPWDSRHCTRVYELARKEARTALASFGGIEADGLDLVHDLLATRLKEIVHAESPRALFCVALKNRAIDRVRSRERELDAMGDSNVSPPQEDGIRRDRDGAAETEERIETMHLKKVLAALPPRDVEILVAIHSGIDREELARAYSVSRAAIDQIVSRARRSERAARARAAIRAGQDRASVVRELGFTLEELERIAPTEEGQS